MDDESSKKFVRFDKYCDSCKYAKKSPTDDPCNDCLGIGAREETEKPQYYEKKE